MAESVLPAGLENLKIDLKRELDDDTTRNDVNPFSLLGSRVCKKKMRKAGPSPCRPKVEEKHSCPLGIFGSECSKPPTSSVLCQCTLYIPTKFQSQGKRLSQVRSQLQIKSTPVFKKNILQKSKLNILKMHEVAKQSCLDPSTLTVGAKPIHLRNSSCPSDAVVKIDTSKCRVGSKTTVSAIAVQDFKSLIPLSEKKIACNVSNPIFDRLSFKSLQNSKPQRRQYCVECPPVKSDEDDLVSSVSRKLSVSGIASNNTASCSQEARLTANAYCDEHDISIDELASYFEDFVHIPKKMSLMAEQMYI